GPDRVTAKRQQKELERVAKTLPASAPSSVKEFTDRAVKSLQVVVSAGVLLLAHAVHC
ncbi:La-related protein 1, partial [Trifolium medium]|nr:La-related protein 1 [Trifolium medium]